MENIRIIDTLPMPVCKTARPGRGNSFDLGVFQAATNLSRNSVGSENSAELFKWLKIS